MDTGGPPGRRRRAPGDALGGGERSLAAWVGELAADEAAAARARTAWLARQAAEEGTFAGVLVDLAERRAAVVVHLHNGRRHAGVVELVGADFCAVAGPHGREVLVAHRGLASIRALPDHAPTVGDRRVRADLALATVLVSLAGLRHRVLLVGHAADDAVAGRLDAVGADVVTVRLDGGGRAYVPVASVLEVGLAEGGVRD